MALRGPHADGIESLRKMFRRFRVAAMDCIKGHTNASIALAALNLAVVLAISPISAQEAVAPGFAAQGAAISGAALPAALQAPGTPETQGSPTDA